ncbi:3-methyladenine DNA glycosylase [Caminibacter mediatlanticus TB-2]|uniref:3-methyladenine DNA glycosylase n=1 Tax=Caminibacter mediatlanticus TB-2 TaxID=391592 RepID=A0ABX5V849_9BACT|nr:3-methyladenine DNA glycosylase [Caminibacter mediatlanticus]QCT94457.1 3-methyladenine DNA glycosylase [Caminibacter mediatlanticus TB-2]
MEFSNSYELLILLREKNLLKNSPKYWWPNVGSFEVVVGAILTQNTKWENVQKALNKWKIENGELRVEVVASFDVSYLAEIIKPVGFYNQKAKRLIALSRNILRDFGNFESFSENVDREWLLNQKGIGFETADSILCYACFREVMVVDAYTKRLLKKSGYEFESYDEMKEWCERGILENWDKIKSFYEDDLNLCFARFHGKIVEFMKK